MKKILLLIFVIFFIPLCAEAKTIRALSLKPFSTAIPSSTFAVQIIQKETITKGTVLEPGTIILGIVLKVNSPKIGKQNGSFEFIPTEFIEKGVSQKIENPLITAKVMGYSPINPSQMTISVIKKIANFFLRGAITALDFIDGAMEAQEGQRFKSGVIKAYKNSFLSYIEPGNELNIKRGDILILKIKTTR